MIEVLAETRTSAETKDACCPNCRHIGALPILSLKDAPVMVCSAFPDPKDALDVVAGDIDLATCTTCGFLFSTSFDQALAMAGAKYESSQAASPHFGAFARGLATDWVQRYGLEGKHIAEIGCGQGEFLIEMLRAGAGSAVGIDPLFGPEFIPAEFQDRLSADAREFGGDHIHNDAAALVCRHAIEHIGDVAGFLALVADWAAAHPDAPILFEAPGTERILAEGAFWDIFYEHCNYFTADTLSDSFARAGLNVTRCELVYDGQYLIIEATGTAPAVLDSDPRKVEAAIRDSSAFSAKVSRAVDLCRERLAKMAADGAPVVLWQGASKAVALMTLLGRDTPIDFAVDLNTRRHGNYLPPFALEVRAPESLVETKPKHVVLMNEVYMVEVRKHLDKLGLTETTLHSINSLFAED
jgi:hypothetical protein